MTRTARGRKPKVYWAEIDGLNEWIVAAPNRTKALEAFGVHQNLFAQGAAGDATAADVIAAARKHPGKPLRRPKGSNAQYEMADETSDWSVAALKSAKPKAKKPNRKPLDLAEARLRQIEDEHRQKMADIEHDRARLDDRKDRETSRYERDKADAQIKRDKAAAAFKKIGDR